MISENSFIHPSVQLGKNVTIGPFSYIGEGVVIGDGCIIESHVVIKKNTKIGKMNRFYQGASIGEDCQDKKYKGEETFLYIGDNNIFREAITVHRGTVQDNGKTVIGNNNLLMGYCHIAHDCVIGNNVVAANGSSFAGHCMIDDYATISGMCGIHQKSKIGCYSFIAAGSMIRLDVPPFVTVGGHGKPVPKGLNLEGLRRNNFTDSDISELKKAYRVFYRSGSSFMDSIALLESNKNPRVKEFVRFIMNSNRGVIK